MDHSYHKLITNSRTYVLCYFVFAAFASCSWIMSQNVDCLDSKVRSWTPKFQVACSLPQCRSFPLRLRDLRVAAGFLQS